MTDGKSELSGVNATAGFVVRSHRFRVYPRPRQERILRDWASTCVLVWNCALEQRERLYREYTISESDDGWMLRYRPSHGIRPGAPIPEDRSTKPRSGRPDGATLGPGRSGGGALWTAGLPKRSQVLDPAGKVVPDQTRQLAAARSGVPELARVPAKILNAVLYDLDEAYKHMWRRAKAGDTLGASKYKSSRGRVRLAFDSIGQTHQILDWRCREYTHLVMLVSARGGEKMGPLRARSDLPLHDRRLGALTIYEERGQWYASVVLRDVVPRPAGAAHGAIGINRGVVYFATTSDGHRLEGFPGDPVLEEEIGRREIAVAWKYECNNRGNLDPNGRLLPGRRRNITREETAERRRLARAIAAAARKRRAELHLIANDLLDRYHTICIEDFDIHRMTRSPHGTIDEPGEGVALRSDLNRRILEKCWGEFARILEYKAAERKNTVIRVDPKNISRQCPECGVTRERNASEPTRVFRCPACGHSEDVDVVAARNVLMQGLGELRARGEASDTSPGALASASAS
jgi:putative transposase